jgi:PAS domain S-box-containing protein
MKPGNTSPPDVNEEIAALIETLHQSEQRLEELTAGEVDTVTNRAGRTVMLQRAQEQLRVSEAAKQAAILNALPAHIALLDSQGCIISVNETWRRFAGANALLSAEYGIDLNYLEICDSAEGKNADEATQAAAGIRSVLAGTAKNYSLEYPCHSPTEQRWFLMTVTPVDDRQNGAVVMHLDITERKLAEQSLRASEAEFHTLAEAMPQIVWITRADGWNIYFNQQWMDYTGLTLEESLGHGWNKPFHPDEQQRARDAWEHATKTHDIYSIESRLRRADGVYRWWLIRGAPLTDANGNILKWLGTCTDIHDMKMLAQLLEAERSRLVAAQRIAKVGSWETDLATFAVIWSEQTHRIFETDPRKFKPTHQAFLELVHPDDRATVDDAFFKSLEQSSSHNIEHRILMPDGRIKFVEEHWQAYFDDQAHPVQAIGTIQDITDRKAAETRIKYLNRVYAVLSGINTLIVRAHDQDELFNEACRIAVEAGGFRMAMIVLVDKNSMKIVPVTTVGKDEELVTAIKNILSSGELASSTMVARAIREKQVIVSNDSQSDPQVLFGNKYAEAGVRSIVIFPLIVADEAIGALALYADAIEFFQEEEMKLLTELASDIAFAIDYIEKQKRINYLAYYDVLTGLANRSLFLERVEQFIRNADNGHRIAVFLIDLERFKSFNAGRQSGGAYRCRPFCCSDPASCIRCQAGAFGR